MTMKPASGGHAAGKRTARRRQRAAVEVLERGGHEAGADHALDRRAAGGRAGVEADDGKAASGAGMSRSQAAVTIPSVPSEPISRLFRS